MRGVSTRVIWMSRSNRSWPTPTVNTGIDRAFRLASGSSSDSSEVSAPSVTMHEAGERQARQLVARPLERRAEARGRAFVLQVARRCPAGRPTTRSGRSAGRTARTAPRAAAARRPNCSWTNSVRGWPSRSAIVMLRESSIRMPRKFCCGHRRPQDQRRPEQAEDSTRQQRRGAARPAPAARATGPSFVMPRYVMRAAAASAASPRTTPASSTATRRTRSRPARRRRAGYLKRNSNSQPMGAPVPERVHSIWTLLSLDSQKAQAVGRTSGGPEGPRSGFPRRPGHSPESPTSASNDILDDLHSFLRYTPEV